MTKQELKWRNMCLEILPPSWTIKHAYGLVYVSKYEGKCEGDTNLIETSFEKMYVSLFQRVEYCCLGKPLRITPKTPKSYLDPTYHQMPTVRTEYLPNHPDLEKVETRLISHGEKWGCFYRNYWITWHYRKPVKIHREYRRTGDKIMLGGKQGAYRYEHEIIEHKIYAVTDSPIENYFAIQLELFRGISWWWVTKNYIL